MPTSVTVNAKSVTIGLTPLELQLLQGVILKEGTSRLEALILSYLQIAQQESAESDRQAVKDFLELATDADRDAVVALMKAKRGGRP